MSNEATNFRELLAEDADDVFFNTEEFGERISFYPAGNGPMRTIAAVIEETERAVSGDVIDEGREEIVVLVRRHAFEGILRPAMGDALALAEDQERFSYTGEVRDSDTATWRLVYARVRPLWIGKNSRR